MDIIDLTAGTCLAPFCRPSLLLRLECCCPLSGEAHAPDPLYHTSSQQKPVYGFSELSDIRSLI